MTRFALRVTASQNFVALGLCLLLHACAREALPDAAGAPDEGNQPIQQEDAGDDMPDEQEPEPQGDGDGDLTSGDGDGDGDDWNGDGDGDAVEEDAGQEPPDAGSSDPDPTDPPDSDLAPSPMNVDACPDKAPKPPFSVQICNVSQALRCLYGKNYSCYCAVGGWICSND